MGQDFGLMQSLELITYIYICMELMGCWQNTCGWETSTVPSFGEYAEVNLPVAFFLQLIWLIHFYPQ